MDFASISLRLPLPEDADLMFQIENNDDFAIYSKGKKEKLSINDIHSFILSDHNLIKYGQIRYTVLVEKKAIGFFDLYDLDLIGKKSAVGLIIHPDFQQKGWGSKALLELEAIASFEHGMKKLYAVVETSNIPAISFFKQAAYRSKIPASDVQIFPKSIYLEKML